MKTYATSEIRNVALVSHDKAGKTSLAEALLFHCGAIDRLGRAEDGNTVCDFDGQEVARGLSIQVALASMEIDGCKLNLLDTPGYADFVAEMSYGLRVCDSALVLVDGVAGVEVGTERAWRMAQDYGAIRMVFVSKLDKEGAHLDRVLEMVRERLTPKAVAVAWPIGSQLQLRGVVDLATMRAWISSKPGSRETAAEIPAELEPEVSRAREALVEAVAEQDDALLERYLDGQELSGDEVLSGLKSGAASGGIVPVFCGSPLRNIGTAALAQGLVALSPPPGGEVTGHKPGDGAVAVREVKDEAPLTVFVFKTLVDPYVGRLSLSRVYAGRLRPDMTALNAARGHKEKVGQLATLRGRSPDTVNEIHAGDMVVIAKLGNTLTGDTLSDPGHPIILPGARFNAPIFSMSVKPKARGDEEKLSGALSRIAEEDAAFRFYRDQETEEIIISGMGQLHLEIAMARLKDQFGVEVEMGKPKIPYRETVRKSGTVHHRYKKQTGGRGQFGDVHLRIEPLERGQGFEFAEEVVGGAIPRQYLPGVEKGVRDALAHGVLAGFPVVDVRVAVFDGQYHNVDSSEFAFRRAASMAVRKGSSECDPVLLEPVVEIEVVVPEECMGDVIGNLNGKRARILGMESSDRSQVIRAHVPLAEISVYGSELRSITAGRGSYTIQPAHYEDVPPHLWDGIIAEYKREIGEED